MHPRHRSPGSGYRSNPMGMGMGSRISPENTGRGHGFYNSEYRGFNRSFGRSHSQPKPFHPPPPPPPLPQPSVAAPLRKGDLFMEAGRLATEYLVSQGILPPGALSGKWQNGSFKEFQEFRSQDEFPADGRARLQDPGSDMGPGRRRYSDEYGPTGFSRNYVKGKRRGGSYRGYNSEWGREYGRSGSWSDRRKGSPGMDTDREYDLRNREEQLVTKTDSTLMEKSSSEVLKSEESGGAQESETKEHASRATSSGAEKDAQDETNAVAAGPLNKSDEVAISKESSEVMKDKDVTAVEETRKEIISEELPKDRPSDKVELTDLQILCKFANMPKRTRSVRGSRVSEEEKTEDAGTSRVSEVLMEDGAVDGSVNNVSDIRVLELEISKGDTPAGAEAVNLVDKALVVEENQELNEKRGEKRVIEEINTNEDSKRVREWLPSVDTDVVGRPTVDERLVTLDDQSQESMANNPQTSSIGEESYAKEKQLFPGSFKICDLNLMGTSDVSETRDRGPVFMYPPIADLKKEVGPVDIDLSISNAAMSTQPPKQVVDSDRAIEVIDLDEDSAPEDREFDISERKPDVAFTGLEGFPANPVQNPSNDIPDNQDGYGLMISELLANEFAGCSSVPEINPLDNMGLNGGAGPLADDDSIYMSLGEIPFLSFMRTWDQPPPQEDGKPF